MFCIIKYVDYEQFQNDELQEELLLTTPEAENKTLLVNPDCPIGILRDYISNVLRFSAEHAEIFELCTEKAVLLNTRQFQPTKIGLDFMKDKETYYIVLMNDEQRETPKVLIPLLNRYSKEYMDFMAQQRRRSSMSSRSSNARKRLSSATQPSASSSVQD